ncbi:hypothetical protein C8Q79DRAFT_411233 [Trametes meyenii]|nr:hypothetical protein C8Q79DRAFT_411233 [Trametes meyenii]
MTDFSLNHDYRDEVLISYRRALFWSYDMGQEWFLFNINKRQHAREIDDKLGAEHYVLPRGLGWSHQLLINTLRKQYLPEAYEDLLTQGRPAARQHGPLGKLAVELLSMIYDQLSSTDALCFAVTCKSLLASGKRRLTQTLTDRHFCWRGDRLILLGDYIYGREKLPNGLLTDAEWDEVVQVTLPTLKSEDGETDPVDEDVSMTSSAQDNYDVIHLPDATSDLGKGSSLADVICQVLGDLRRPRLRRPQVPRPDTDSADRDGSSTPPSREIVSNDLKNIHALWPARYEIGNGVEVVCNLLKGEYIRADGFTLPYAIGLGQALLACITWSASNDVAMCIEDEFLERLVQGSWAGGRFMVTTVDALPALGPGELGGREWRDITKSVDGLLWHIWDQNDMEEYCMEYYPEYFSDDDE